ncbi:MAG: zinc ribbon domain-containing protein [Candidatus Hydrothermarchaeota archaeon]|nr:zinc ribbon domain-containing protein [Candidatus Hydrothermarchaeota archaeon]
MRMTKKLILIFAAVFFLFLAYLFGDGIPREISSKLLGIFILIFSYVTGILAIFLNAALLFIGFILSLPVISNVYNFIAAVLSKILGMLIKNILRRMERYRNFELKVKNSETYLQATQKIRSIARKPVKIKFFSVVDCENCKKEIPGDGKFCPYCGAAISQPSARS